MHLHSSMDRFKVAIRSGQYKRLNDLHSSMDRFKV